MSDGMGREFAYLSSHANNRYFIPNWGNALMKVSNKLYNEISGHCPLKLWKDRLKAVWGDETR